MALKKIMAAGAIKPVVDKQQVFATKEAAVLKHFAENKLRKEDNFTPFEREVLIRHGIITEEVAHPGQPAPIQNTTTQVELAVMLGRYFHGQIKGDVSKQLLSDWKVGKRLRPGVPLPPAKEGSYFVGTKWVAWLEAHILTDPRYRLGAAGVVEMDVHAQAHKAKANIILMQEEEQRIFLDKTKGRYLTTADAQKLRRAGLRLLLGIFRRASENNLVKQRADWLALKLSPLDLIAFQEFDLKLAQEQVDTIYRECAQLAAATPETELAQLVADED